MEVKILRPAQECFKQDIFQAVGHGQTYIFDKVEYTKNQGILLYYQGCTFPKHGFPFPEVMASVNIAKRSLKMLLKYVNPLYGLYKFNSIVADYYRVVDNVMMNYWLKDELLCPMAAEAKKMFIIALSDIKLDTRLADIIGQILEYDDAYRFFFQDILTCLSPENLFSVKTYRLVNKIVKERACNFNPKTVTLYIKMFSIAMLIPKVRKAFIKALTQIDFSKLQFDEYDRYWVMNRNDWNFLGRPHADRREEWLRLNNGIEPEGIEY